MRTVSRSTARHGLVEVSAVRIWLLCSRWTSVEPTRRTLSSKLMTQPLLRRKSAPRRPGNDCAAKRMGSRHVPRTSRGSPLADNRRTYTGCSSRFGDKLLNKSSLIRVTAAPVSSRSRESVPATLACTKIDDGLVKATTCTASCWERPVGGVGSRIDCGPLGTLPMPRAGRFPGDEVGSVSVRSGTGVIGGLGRRSCNNVVRVPGQQ
ncbi:hypothetical protein T12_15477 [Trichinella patagoniensis]|uniref:Uncharacterized protein n=1 Tax=Trichinella patagoniensis TaxID=990121 RepID=A0A0V0Z7R3_9BILA|nr:hypothetical protein T12_15477 [Trichinella patagoniensis]